MPAVSDGPPGWREQVGPPAPGGLASFMELLAGTPLRVRARLLAPMSEYTSFRIGGPADVLVEPAGADEVRFLISAAKRAGLPCTVIGAGTNLLVLDGGIRGFVMRIGPAMAALDWEPATPAVVAGAGVPLGFLSRAAAIRGYTGLEFAEGIPGSLGGAVVMNAGAYGGQMGDLVEWAEAVEGDAAAGPRRLGPPELDFSYRHSALQESAAVVVRARLLLKHDRREDVEARCDEFAARRRERQPLEWPSAGSFFKRPPGRYAGPLIEGCGLKGLRVGGAQVSLKHANFIVNLGGATAADVLALAAEVRRRVADRFGVTLEPEVRILGQMAPPGQSLL